MKMKTAVIFGVVQMTGGIFLKGLNALYFGDRAVFWLEFMPMIIFDFCLFVYMAVLIFTKWAINWDRRQLMGGCGIDGLTFDQRPCSDGDSLKHKCALNFVGEPMYSGQGSAQSALLAIAFLSVPVLLLGKPVYIYFQHASQPASASQPISTQIEMDQDSTSSEDPKSKEVHSFSEVLIHQCIETIEFVLGMVSNTASYLRLWALSLAHTELAQVFWEKIMRT